MVWAPKVPPEPRPLADTDSSLTHDTHDPQQTFTSQHRSQQCGDKTSSIYWEVENRKELGQHMYLQTPQSIHVSAHKPTTNTWCPLNWSPPKAATQGLMPPVPRAISSSPPNAIILKNAYTWHISRKGTHTYSQMYSLLVGSFIVIQDWWHSRHW